MKYITEEIKAAALEILLKRTDFIPYAKNNPPDKFLLHAAHDISGTVGDVILGPDSVRLDMFNNDPPEIVAFNAFYRGSRIKETRHWSDKSDRYSHRPYLNPDVIEISNELHALFLTL